jgi:hypothetical protein
LTTFHPKQIKNVERAEIHLCPYIRHSFSPHKLKKKKDTFFCEHFLYEILSKSGENYTFYGFIVPAFRKLQPA